MGMLPMQAATDAFYRVPELPTGERLTFNSQPG
jgi:hypothetical protein